MLRRFGLTLVAIACLGSLAQAQTWEVPRAYAIPLPPLSEPRWELGGRFWASEGKTRFDINSSKVDPTLGNPTSVLTYDDMDGYSGEVFWYARNETNTFAKGFFGGGGLTASTTRITSPARSSSPTPTASLTVMTSSTGLSISVSVSC